MTPQEFEEAVRELRRRQKRFFRCRKEDPDRETAKRLMREQEQLLWPTIKIGMANRSQGRNFKNKREEFFAVVVDMMKKQHEWMKQGGGTGFMYAAHEAEKMVDKWLAKYDEENAAEKRRRIEQIQAKQPKLF